jgi:glycosyltransferase involved in cell wall biosynthesis
MGRTMDDSPLVSVIIPVYNGERYVKDAIESVLGQTYKNIQIIAVNNDSPDGSLHRLNEYKDKIEIITEYKRGVAHARNAGIERSQGEYLAFLDQDDFWKSHKIEQQIAIIKSNPNTVLVHTGIEHYDDATGCVVGPVDVSAHPEEYEGNCFRKLLLKNAIYNSSVLVKRNVVIAAGAMNTAMAGNTCQDYDLWLRISQKGSFSFIRGKLTRFRLHSNQGSVDRRQLLSDEGLLIENELIKAGLLRDVEMRKRMADLYDELAIAHLDAGLSDRAKIFFWKAAGWKASARTVGGYLACFLPAKAINAIRKIAHGSNTDHTPRLGGSQLSGI